jgi:manganese transport system ATP-binding protein
MPDVVIAEDVVITRGERIALDVSSFRIPEGKITAIIGPNGSGKSTILHAIAGLIPIDSGTLRVNDTEPLKNQKNISYVLQYAAVPAGTPLTVAETVLMGRYSTMGALRRPSPKDRATVAEAMSHLNISDLAQRHLAELSGGQRQRVFVAQGIAQDHSVLLLDEPLTGLDITSARIIDGIIHDEPSRGCSVVLTTHDLEEAKAADHVILTSGRVVSSGSPAQVLTSKNLTQAYGLGALHDQDDAAALFPTEHHHEEGGH